MALSEVGQATRGIAGNATKQVGEWVDELMVRLTPDKLKYQDLADRMALFCRSQKEWVNIGGNAFWHVSGMVQTLGPILTENGVRGFMNLWKAALRHPVSGNYMHYLYSVCTVGGVIDKQGLARILEMFESQSSSAYKFVVDAVDPAKWISPGGVVYGLGGQEGHRIMHILTHTVPGCLGKTKHSVWNVARHEVFPLIDEAWALKGTAVKDRNEWVYLVDMSHRGAVGTGGETLIKIVVEDLGGAASNRIVSAYPIN